MTDTADLHRLLDVQDVDLAIDQQRHRRAHLAERQALGEIDAQSAALTDDLASVGAARDEVAKRQADAETELAATESRSAAVSRRLYSGEVSASRELKAMADDVDALKIRASALEDHVLELLEEREPLDARLEELTATLIRLEERRTDALQRLGEAEAEVDGELSTLATRRAEAAAGVPEALMSVYERLRARLGGVGVARVVGNHCDGCHLTLSAMELDHLRHLPAGEVPTCEQCSRILVP